MPLFGVDPDVQAFYSPQGLTILTTSSLVRTLLSGPIWCGSTRTAMSPRPRR
jgi:hypothetical protein